MNLAPSTMALGLDQVPESLLPTLAYQSILPLTILDMGTVVVIFLILELALSRLLFKLHIRDRPF
jgi:CDP-2,3-bis-(O-geranylgeranyl)-sn-glycerol synthase